MNSNYYYYVVAKQHHAALIAETQHRRMIQAVARIQHPAVFYAPILARLGRWMIAWGWRLRARYGEVEFSTLSE